MQFSSVYETVGVTGFGCMQMLPKQIVTVSIIAHFRYIQARLVPSRHAKTRLGGIAREKLKKLQRGKRRKRKYCLCLQHPLQLNDGQILCSGFV